MSTTAADGTPVTFATTLGDLVRRTAAAHGGHDALIFPDERIRYAEFDARSDAFARSLMALGIGLRDKVGVLLPNCIDHVVALIGIAKAGAVAVPVNARFKERELRHVIRASDMRALIAAASDDPRADQSALIGAALEDLSPLDRGASPEGAPLLRAVVSFGPAAPTGFMARERFEALAEATPPERLAARSRAVRVRDAAVLMFTSGTTSAPKAAILSHEAITRQAMALSEINFRLTPQDRVWHAMPLFHIGGMEFLFACFAKGATAVHAGHFDPAVSLRQIRDLRCTAALPAFETIWLAVVGQPEFRKEDLPDLRLIMNVGAPERLRQVQAMLPDAVMISAFGATEGCSFLTAGRPDDPLDERIETLGQPMPGVEVRIVSPETGEDLPAGEVGEIIYRGPTMFDGYYGEPELTAEAIDADGFFHSGDLGDLDDKGRLRYFGRLKDMLKVGGENVAALEIEEFLIQHPAIKIAQVVSAPDAYYGEVAAAYLELHPGRSVTEAEVIEHCRGQIATFKIPRYVRVVEDWPMSGTKIRKVDLRAEIAAELKAAGIESAPKIDSHRMAG